MNLHLPTISHELAWMRDCDDMDNLQAKFGQLQRRWEMTEAKQMVIFWGSPCLQCFACTTSWPSFGTMLNCFNFSWWSHSTSREIHPKKIYLDIGHGSPSKVWNPKILTIFSTSESVGSKSFLESSAERSGGRTAFEVLPGIVCFVAFLVCVM